MELKKLTIALFLLALAGANVTYGIRLGAPLGLRSARASYEKMTYEECKEQFKLQLCRRQPFMDYDTYMSFVEPYLQEAEQKFKIIHYFKTEGRLPFVDDYFNCLLDYNVACFASKEEIKHVFDEQGARLHKIMDDIEKSGAIEGFQAAEEFAKTAELFHRANVAFYKEAVPHHLTFAMWCKSFVG